MNLPKKPLHKRNVYLDHAAATPLRKEVLCEVEPWLKKHYANPSGLYGDGVFVRKHIEASRKDVAAILHTNPDTIVFTSGGTESVNLAILGVARAHAIHGKHIITTRIEHRAVLGPIEYLERQGFEVTYLDADETGMISPAEFKRALRKGTILVSIMYANNEIGTIEPIAQIGKEILKWRKNNDTVYPYFHSDACQAAGTLDLNVEKLHVDLMSINASKIYGPKGVGLLYKRRGFDIEPLLYGGGQEHDLRSGTENIAGIAGLAKALVLANHEKQSTVADIRDVRDYFCKRLQEEVKDITINGPALESDSRTVFNLHVSFVGVEADALVLYLDEYGIMCSKGSACETDSGDSHVLKAIGLSADQIKGAVRFTLGGETNKKDIDYVMKCLPGIVDSLRNLPQ